MQENLLGYLLGALDGPEHEQVRQQLENDPGLREQLSLLENRLAPLEQERWQYEPPSGLAAATCRMVVEHASSKTPQSRQADQLSRESQRRRMSSMSEWNPRKHGWDMIDMAVAAGIFVAAALLFFPAIANSRDQARQLACQNNLRSGSFALSIFGDRHNGVFPYIPPSGKTGVAGYYAPQLVEGGYLTQHASFLCPSSNLATRMRNEFTIPTNEQILNAEGAQLNRLQQYMGGSYMYNLGHFSRGVHRSTLNRGRSYFPIMSDGMQNTNGTFASSHGGGKGINVVFEGGNVRLVVQLTLRHPYFVSDRGVVEAGAHVEDAVLGHSWNRPNPSQPVDEREYPNIDPDSDLYRDLNSINLDSPF